VAEYLRRATVVGITWPVPAGLDDSALEARLFSPPFATHGSPDHSRTGRGFMLNCAVPGSTCCCCGPLVRPAIQSSHPRAGMAELPKRNAGAASLRWPEPARTQAAQLGQRYI
jgi:hypothetical protein